MIRISVIVPVHGAEPYLARCIDALFLQRHPTWRREIIFVDNGLLAGARAVLDRHPALRVIEEPGRGAYAARNAGIRAARGEIIAFTDADCAVAPNWLEAIEDGMADPEAGVLVGSYLPARGTFPATALAAYENEKNRYIFSSADDDLYYGFTNNMAVRARLFDEIGEFLPRLRGSDAIFVRRVVESYGPGSVRFAAAMGVRHLEIGGALDYYRKAFVHSRSIRSLGRVVSHRALGPQERLQVFRNTVQANDYSAIAAGGLFALLAFGLVAWKAGGLVRWRDIEMPASGEAQDDDVRPGPRHQVRVANSR